MSAILPPTIGVLAGELARVALALGQLAPKLPSSAPGALEDAAKLRLLRMMIKRRRAFEEQFGVGLFGDPVRDMLLDLYASELEGRLNYVSSLTLAAAVPQTTALRMLTDMAERGLVLRHNDPSDGRRVFVSLAPETRTRLDQWLTATADAVAAALRG